MRQTVFSAGLVIGALLSALVLSVAGAPVQALLGERLRWCIVAAVGVSLALRGSGTVSFWLPENRRLVPETVFRNGPTWSALQFGIEMGSGARTFVTSSLPYLLAVAVVCVANVEAAAAAAAGFGLGRALMTWASAWRQDPAAWRTRWTSSSAISSGLLGVGAAAGLAALAAAAG